MASSAMPKLLFRVWSSQSHGTNSKTIFCPESRSEPSTSQVLTPASIPDFPQKLRGALLGRPIPPNHFVFFTDSPLFAFVFADWSRALGKTDLRITCVNTSTAVTAQGRPVTFYAVRDLLKQHKVELRNRDDSLREYPDEYVALSTVMPKGGSCCAKVQTLIDNGLYDLYPALGEINKRHNAHLYSTLKTLRSFGFEKERAFTMDQIEVAAKLAFTFRDCVVDATSDVDRKTEKSLLAWFLALQKRPKQDDTLRKWINSHSSTVLDGEAEADSKPNVMDSERPELMQYAKLLKLFENQELQLASLSPAPKTSRPEFDAEKAKWDIWSQLHRDERRAARGADHPTKPSRDRHDERFSRPLRRRYGDTMSQAQRRDGAVARLDHRRDFIRPDRRIERVYWRPDKGIRKRRRYY